MQFVQRLQPEAQAPRQRGDGPPQTTLLQVIGGSAARQRLHAIHPAQPGQQAAATGFALAIILALQRGGHAPVLWVQERSGAAESGRPYGLGLAGLGLSPDRLVVVDVKGAMDALAAAEMGLEEAGLAGVLVDLPPRLPADMLRLGKRLSLRCAARQTPCFLLHASRDPVEMPVATRWQVASAPRTDVPQAGAPHGQRRVPNPDFTTAFDVVLSKNRFGALGRWSVAWQRLPPGMTEVETAVAHASGVTHHDADSFSSERFGFQDHFGVQDLGSTAAQPVVPELANRPAGTAGGAQPVPIRSAAA